MPTATCSLPNWALLEPGVMNCWPSFSSTRHWGAGGSNNPYSTLPIYRDLVENNRDGFCIHQD